MLHEVDFCNYGVLLKIAMTHNLHVDTILPMVEINDSYEPFAKRLIELMARDGISVTKLSKVAGVTYEMASRYTKAISKPRDSKLKAIADLFGVTEAYLNYGADTVSEPVASYSLKTTDADEIDSKISIFNVNSGIKDKNDFITIPKVDINQHAENKTDKLIIIDKYTLPFRRLDLQKRGHNVSSLVIVGVTGDSMKDQLNDGDFVSADKSKTKIIDGKMYAIIDGYLLRVKILIERPDGGLIIRSYNRDDYPDEVLTKEHRNENVIVIGQVWWSSRLW